MGGFSGHQAPTIHTVIHALEAFSAFADALQSSKVKPIPKAARKIFLQQPHRRLHSSYCYISSISKLLSTSFLLIHLCCCSNQHIPSCWQPAKSSSRAQFPSQEEQTGCLLLTAVSPRAGFHPVGALPRQPCEAGITSRELEASAIN